MFKRNKSKAIDLLEQYYLATKKKNIFQEYLKYLILPLVLVFIIGGAFGYLKVKQGNYKNDIAEIKQKISDLEKSYKDSDYEEKYASLQEIQKILLLILTYVKIFIMLVIKRLYKAKLLQVIMNKQPRN